MKKKIFLLPLAIIFSIVMFTGCDDTSDPILQVSELKVTKIALVEKTSSTTVAPVTYDVTLTWSTADILADEKASAALTGLKVIIQSGTTEEFSADLASDVTTYTFKGLLSGESKDLTVQAVYAADAFPKASSSDFTDSFKFHGGPWYDGTSTTYPSLDGGFGVGSFNNINAMPTGSFTIDDVYYYNDYNTNYQFKNTGETIWMRVDVNEVTTTNDTDTQRNNVQWLGDDFQMVDKSSTGLSDYSDLADVDVKIIDINGNELLSMTGSETSKTMTSANFTKLINSVNSGYYADKTGYYFIKATCRTMPSTYSSSNSDAKYGIWGIANNNPRR